ncbi:MAG: efflux transporter periplasmic adaptor subunit [Deltaproteobacteria bacterium HGW-Deltaproteobacteria-19]|nr:MAG: efflux transporter periplasmic adaptor subunit [Deltaproteobacteria bacterium HGW-Deltaproteobacteria-19]
MQIFERTGRMAAAVIFLCILITAGCGQQTGGGPPQGGPPEVAVITIQPQPVATTTELAGRTKAHQIAEVRPQVGGIVQRRLFTEGSDVRAGQVLYQIDPATYQAAFDNARAALARSEANLPAIRLKAERVRELLADKAVSQQDYDDATAALKQAEADVQYWKATVENARINLKYTSVTAPISGRIGRSSVTEGALVSAQQPASLATIQRLDPMYVDVPQSTTELLRLRRSTEEGRLDQNGTKQRKVRLILDDGRPYPLEGTLEFRDITVDPTTGSVVLRAVFPNPKGILLPGMYVRAVVQEGIHKQAILVPQQAVSRDPKGNPLALIVDAEGKVQQRMITTDRAIGDQWLVTSGLAAGEKVIVEGMQKARPGSTVKAVPFVAEEEKSPVAANGTTPQPAAKNGR